MICFSFLRDQNIVIIGAVDAVDNAC